MSFPIYAGKHAELSTPLVMRETDWTPDFGSPEIQRGLSVLVYAAFALSEAEGNGARS